MAISICFGEIVIGDSWGFPVPSGVFLFVREGQLIMARKKKSSNAAFVSLDVVYEDGTQSSNRRIPSELLEMTFGDEDVQAQVRTAIEEQDNRIAEKSGYRKAKIKSIKRA